MRIPLEVIYRALAYGSFLRRYSGHVRPMEKFDLVEFNLKADELGDPLLERSAIPKMKIATEAEVERMEAIAREVAGIVARALAGFRLELVDIKLEFGRVEGKLVVIDALSGDTMRVYEPAEKSAESGRTRRKVGFASSRGAYLIEARSAVSQIGQSGMAQSWRCLK